jgi:transposase-like protein
MTTIDRRRSISHEDEREIVRLRSDEGLTYKEIASRFPITKSQVCAVCVKHLDPERYSASRKRHDRAARVRKNPGAPPRALSTTQREKKRAYMRDYERRRRAERRVLLDRIKAEPCMDCGRSFPAVCMDFDHREFADKRFNIGERYANVAMDDLLAEIAKCDVVCACCHRLRTHVRDEK